ncbi:two-component sensor histidine kinase [Herbaspirillum sp. meg3]|uniref:ATP-binding protein n=1 Tax=Herbaspirillum sp. meg3 TaxID=2025949 RepID=UPI000B989F51|nr:ATP-binding protein [Herbaspirillum sp. meg3]ASU38603.1 two-component sensor histidine kinase [Herbaspirillum sp. meg3]
MGRLFWKFFFFIMVAQMTAIIGVGIMFSFENRERNQRVTDLDLSPPAMFTIRSAAATLQYGGTEALRKLILNAERHQVYVVNEDQQELLGRDVNPKLIEEARSLLTTEVRRRVVEEIKASDGHTYLLFLPSPSHMNSGREPRHENPPPPPPPFSFPMMPMLVSTVASLLFAMLLAWYFSQPIRQLKSAFANAASGNLNDRLAPLMSKRSDELADLGRDFDSMTDKLRALMESQRRLLHDVSHELRSPIARLQASIGLARLQPEKTAATLERIEREGVRMDKLVGELLTLSRLEAGVTGAMEDHIRIEDLLGEIIDDARFEAESIDRHVEGQARTNAVIKGGAELLYRAIENVVRNAIKQTAVDTVVAINTLVDQEKKQVQISVIDRGPGVPEDELQLIFEPFFRSTRTQKSTHGYGLGLTIARRIVEAHGGTIRAFNRIDGGLCVNISLPYDSIDPLPSSAGSNDHHP